MLVNNTAAYIEILKETEKRFKGFRALNVTLQYDHGKFYIRVSFARDHTLPKCGLIVDLKDGMTTQEVTLAVSRLLHQTLRQENKR